jgi:hypothetical protein
MVSKNGSFVILQGRTKVGREAFDVEKNTELSGAESGVEQSQNQKYF